MGKKVLVTGAGGFIGSHLTERLVRDGHDVRALVRYNGRDDHGQSRQQQGDAGPARDIVEIEQAGEETARQRRADREEINKVAA